MSAFDKVKELQQSLKNKSGRGLVHYFEDDTTTVVRILPLKGEPIPFKQIFVHYPSGGIVPKTMLSPKTFGEPDRMETYVSKELKKGKKPKNEYIMLKNMEPSPVMLAPIIIRGKENEGVKYLSLNESQFDDLIQAVETAFAPEEAPEIWDVETGNDIKVTVKAPKSDKEYRKISYVVDQRETPLQSDNVSDEQVEKWLNEQPSWEEAYEKASNEDLSEYFKSSQEEESGGESLEDDEDLAEYAKEEDLDEDSDVVNDALSQFKEQSLKEEEEDEDEAVIEENPFG